MRYITAIFVLCFSSCFATPEDLEVFLQHKLDSSKEQIAMFDPYTFPATHNYFRGCIETCEVSLKILKAPDKNHIQHKNYEIH